MTEAAVVAATEVPSIGLSYNVELPGKRSIVLQSHVPQEISKADLDSLLDKLRDVAERQYSWGMVAILEKEVEQQERIAIDHANNMKLAETSFQDEWANRKKRGDPQLTPKEAQEKVKAQHYLEEAKRRVVMVREDLAKHRRIVGLPEK